MTREDVHAINRRAWDAQVERGNAWTMPVTPEVIAAARRGAWSLLLTNLAPVPRRWFPANLAGLRTLGLAAGGGQQGPILAAAGARVTVLDASPRQLDQDRAVAKREKLDIILDEGDMADLSRYPDASFDLVFNPCSTLFVPDVKPVWRECFRVLRAGGILMTGFLNPVTYVFDREKMADGVYEARHRLPYSDLQMSAKQREKLFGPDEPVEFSHTLTDLIGGQLSAGFVLTDLYEDQFGDPRSTDPYFPGLIATRALRP
jgi:SAM-dependent methyltransferase